MGQLATGSPVDTLLKGGLETDCLTTVYGPAGAGKTNFALLAAIQAARAGKQVLYIDTEGGYSVERLKQLAHDYQHVLERILFFRPTTFSEQVALFPKLQKLANVKIGLIVIDSISMLYRLELHDDPRKINQALGKQLAVLTAIARQKDIPILVTNQVYSIFDEREKVQMVGGDLLKYGSKCILELQIVPGNKRRAILKKHRSQAPEQEILFKIVEKGFEETKESKGFYLFKK